MASLRDIRRKIRAVRNIQQITQAMKMIAAQRLRQVQARVTAAKPYSEKMWELVASLASHTEHIEHPLLDVRTPAGSIGVVVVSGDKGLCGSFNNNVIRLGVNTVQSLQSPEGTSEPARPVKLITIGRKATDYFRKRQYHIHASFPQISVDASYAQVRTIVDAITGFFLVKTVDEVHIVYTEFITSLHQRPRAIKFLPIETLEYTSGNAHPGNVAYIFEPEAPQLLGKLLPRYVETQIHHLLLESLTSELGARMTAMTNATENAGELIETLTLSYNKARQTAITKELLEVVSGAEALKSGG